jgi:hypothetical protein
MRKNSRRIHRATRKQPAAGGKRVSRFPAAGSGREAGFPLPRSRQRGAVEVKMGSVEIESAAESERVLLVLPQFECYTLHVG